MLNIILTKQKNYICSIKQHFVSRKDYMNQFILETKIKLLTNFLPLY